MQFSPRLPKLAEKGGSIIADMAADILGKKVDPNYGDNIYGAMFAFGRGRGKTVSYLEYLARQEVKAAVGRAVKAFFAKRESELTQQVAERLSVEDIAGSYMAALLEAFSEGTFSINIGVERTECDSDYGD